MTAANTAGNYKSISGLAYKANLKTSSIYKVPRIEQAVEDNLSDLRASPNSLNFSATWLHARDAKLIKLVSSTPVEERAVAKLGGSGLGFRVSGLGISSSVKDKINHQQLHAKIYLISIQ